MWLSAFNADDIDGEVICTKYNTNIKQKEKMKKIICSLVQLVAGMALFFCFALSTSAVVNMVALAVVCGVCFGAQWVQDHVHVSID